MGLNNFTVIEGNIGSGKTTLCKKIAQEYDTNIILEEFEENPFLKEFLKDQKINPLGVELQFLIDRYHQLNAPFENNKPTVADYFIEKSLIFSSNNLSEIEKNLFNQYYSLLFDNIKKPDLLIYLSVSPERLIENIAKRGRIIEQELTKEYLSSIHESYIKYLNDRSDSKVVIVDVSEIDFVKDESQYLSLKEIITGKYKNGVTHIKI